MASCCFNGKKLFPESIIKNLSITFDSYYYVMAPKFRLQQPRRVLESKLLKHITKLDDFEKKRITIAFYLTYTDFWIVVMVPYMLTLRLKI